MSPEHPPQVPINAAQIRRRAVFFVPGFDPASPRQHRERYRREGAEQAAISGYELEFGGATAGPHAWSVRGRIDAAECQSQIEVLSWSDIVARQMRGGPLLSYARLARTAWIYMSSGALRRLVRLRKGPVLAISYPVWVLLIQALLALVPVTVLGTLGGTWGLPGALLGWLLGLGPAYALLAWFKRHDGRLLAHYLIHDFAYAVQDRGAYPEELAARLNAFADRVANAHAATQAATQFDEVLIVGHSSGAALAVSLLARLEREGRLPKGQVALLTLGHAIPMLSFLPGATRLRADLAQLSESDAITWLDVSAPGDGCAFALCDPVAVSGVAGPGKRWPLVISAAFRQTLSPERRHALRWRFFRLHFQYLSAFDHPGLYDYFAITAGPLSLAQRISGRRPSQSRIETALSPHRDRAA